MLPPDFPNRKRLVRNDVVYFPRFADDAALNNHYHRACWYLPQVPGILDRVVMGVDGDAAIGERPAHMATGPQSCDHIVLERDDADYFNALLDARLVVVADTVPAAVIATLKAADIPVEVVTTDDPEVAEYGVYCKLIWRLHNAPERRAALDQGRRRFDALAENIRQKDYQAACLFGTGPSVDTAFNHDFSNCFTHVCNSIVQSPELLDHIRPDLISAGDVVSHFGVSTYAEQFRADLVAYMQASGTHFLTTAAFGILFMVQHPEVADLVILCDQGPALPNFALDQEWWLPGLDSVLNIMMLPAAATFCDQIFVLGCDGKNPDPEKNEDFWAHSEHAQYHDLVDSGHLCHPMFEVHRQSRTWARFQSSVRISFDIGEGRFGKTFTSLAPSFTPGVTERFDADARLP